MHPTGCRANFRMMGILGGRENRNFSERKVCWPRMKDWPFDDFGIGFEQARRSVSFQNELGRRAQGKWECKIIVAFCGLQKKPLRLTEDTYVLVTECPDFLSYCLSPSQVHIRILSESLHSYRLRAVNP